MRLVALTALPILLAACAYTPGERVSREDDGGCLRASQIRGFSAIDSRHVVVTESPGEEHFLITTTGGCIDLKHTNDLAIKSQSSFCVRKHDRILTPEFGNDRVDTCFIRTIERVENKEAAEALLLARENPDEPEEPAEY
ncbi:MAG: DUF6491 family protein [Hyphomonadaceae bacterium]